MLGAPLFSLLDAYRVRAGFADEERIHRCSISPFPRHFYHWSKSDQTIGGWLHCSLLTKGLFCWQSGYEFQLVTERSSSKKGIESYSPRWNTLLPCLCLSLSCLFNVYIWTWLPPRSSPGREIYYLSLLSPNRREGSLEPDSLTSSIISESLSLIN